MKSATPPEKSCPLRPSNPPLRVGVLSGPPFLGVWLGARRGGGLRAVQTVGGDCELCRQLRARHACASPSEVYPPGKLQWHFTCGFHFRHGCHVWPLLQSWRGWWVISALVNSTYHIYPKCCNNSKVISSNTSFDRGNKKVTQTMYKLTQTCSWRWWWWW